MSAVTSSPSASETASQTVFTGQSPEKSYSTVFPSVVGPARDRRPVDAVAASWISSWVRMRIVS